MRNEDERQGQTERESDHSDPRESEPKDLKSRLRWAQESQALAVRILNLLNQQMTGMDAIRRVLGMVKEFTGFEAVAIRLREGDDFPYFVTDGFPDDFVEAERYLCDRDEAGQINRDEDGNPVLECMCGNILRGRTDSSYSFFTEGGSFWSCHTTELLATTTDTDRQTRTRNRCNSAGYESVALIPLRSDRETIGLLQLNDSRKGCFTPDMITFFEGIGASIGIVLARVRTEEALRKSGEELETKVVERTEELRKANELLQLELAERRRAEKALRENEGQKQAILDGITTNIAFVDEDLEIKWVNKAAADSVGKLPSRMIGHRCHEFWANSDKPCEGCPTVKAFETKKSEQATIVTPDGRVWDEKGEPVFDDAGKLIGVVEIAQDITDRKRAEDALRESEEKFAKAFHASPDVLIISHRDTGRIIETNEKWESTFGYTREEAIGRSSLELGLLENPEVRSNVILKLTQQGFLRDYEMNIRRKSGEIRQTLLSAESIEIKGEPCILSVVHDITERKRAEEALRTSEAQLSNAVVMAHLGHWEYDVAEDLFTFNDQFYKIFRTTADEVGGYKMSSADYARQFVHPDDIAVVADETRKAIETDDPSFSRRLEHRMLYADGEIGYISVRFFLVKDELGRTVKTYGVNQDITDRKRSEEKNVQLAAIVESSDDAIIGKSLDGVITSWNKAAEKIYGYKDTEIVGKPISRLTPPHRQDEIPQLLERIKQGEHVEHYETVRRRKDGHDIDVSLTISPTRNADGRIIGASAIARDITEQKNLQRQLLQSQKMEAVGILAGGVAHDFNNLLTVIQGFSELLLLETDEKAPGCADLRKIQESALRGAELVRNLLAFSRKVETKPRPINLNHEVTQMEKLLSRTIPKMIKIELHLEGDLAAVNADPDQMGQVLMNLAVNAEQAMPDGGKLTIATANISLDEAYCRLYREIMQPGDYVLLTVSDTGHGVDEKTLEHIFEPFFTTKGVGKGTGLGLAMVYGIVRQHRGLIICDSRPNEGATFKIYLPAIKEDRIEKEGMEEKVLPRGGTETILLVDDEDYVLDLGTRFLTRAGYTVLTAASGPEAVRLYQKGADKISLVILDLIMPEMGGDKCLEEILAINPNAKSLIASGAAVEGKRKETLESGARGFVNKPFRLGDMLKAVREVLDSA